MSDSQSTVTVPDGRRESAMLGYLSTLHNHVWPGIDGMTTEVVLESYWRAALAGWVPDRKKLLRLHPELEEELRAAPSEELTCGSPPSAHSD